MTTQDVQPADCHAKVRRIAAELELVRAEMGRPKDSRPAFVVSAAQPRECYFGALTVFRKADSLCWELTGDDLEVLPEAPALSQLRPMHVLAVLEGALREVLMVKQHLGIQERVEDPKPEAGREPGDVFQAMIGVSRQLNLLLERPFAPSDCLEIVSQAGKYASHLLANLGAPGPKAAAYQPQQRPADCYARLSAVVDRLREVMHTSGLKMFESPVSQLADVVPSDVYDLASLVLAEVAFLHAHVPDSSPPAPFSAHHPRRRLPSHVQQAAATLEAQLEALKTVAAAQPNWARR
jgi:hypothetical protein